VFFRYLDRQPEPLCCLVHIFQVHFDILTIILDHFVAGLAELLIAFNLLVGYLNSFAATYQFA